MKLYVSMALLALMVALSSCSTTYSVKEETIYTQPKTVYKCMRNRTLASAEAMRICETAEECNKICEQYMEKPTAKPQQEEEK